MWTSATRLNPEIQILITSPAKVAYTHTLPHPTSHSSGLMADYLLNYDVLFSTLAYLSRHGLTALALSSRYFAHAVQEHLYRNITLDKSPYHQDGRIDTFELLLRTLSESPVLRNLVRNVVIYLRKANQTLVK